MRPTAHPTVYQNFNEPAAYNIEKPRSRVRTSDEAAFAALDDNVQTNATLVAAHIEGNFPDLWFQNQIGRLHYRHDRTEHERMLTVYAVPFGRV